VTRHPNVVSFTTTTVELTTTAAPVVAAPALTG
jgi:hypothetical protein